MLKFRIIIVLLGLVITANAQMNKRLRAENIADSDPVYAASVIYSQAVTEYLTGNSKRAVELYKKVISIDNEHSAALYQLARILRDKEPRISMNYAERAYRADSSNREIMKLYINVLLLNNELQRAQDMLAEGREQSQNRQENYYFSIVVAAQLHDEEKVISLGSEYLRYWGHNSEVVKALSEAMVSKKLYFQLDSKLEELALSNPMEVDLRVMMGRVKATLMDDKAAKENFRAAINIDSTGYEGYLALADYYHVKNDMVNYLDNVENVFRAKNLSASIKAKFFEDTFFDPQMLKEHYFKVRGIINTLGASEPQDAEVERVTIRFMMYVGELKTAQQMIRNQIERGVAMEDGYKNLIDIELYQKNYDSVYMLAAQAHEKFPESVEFPLNIAVAKWLEGHSDVALEQLKKCVKLTKNDSILSVIYSMEGDILYKKGMSKKAFVAYDKALKHDADNAMLLNNYAYYLSLERVRLEDALAMSVKANQLEENNSTYLDTQAWILYELGRYEEARTIQRMAVALSKEKSPELMLHYGDILYKLGDKTLANIYWKRAAEAGADKEEVAKRLRDSK